MTMPRMLAMVTAVAAGLQLLSHSPSGSAGMLAAVTVVLAGLALAMLAHGAGILGAVASRPLTGRTRALLARPVKPSAARSSQSPSRSSSTPRQPGAARCSSSSIDTINKSVPATVR